MVLRVTISDTLYQHLSDEAIMPLHPGNSQKERDAGRYNHLVGGSLFVLDSKEVASSRVSIPFLWQKLLFLAFRSSGLIENMDSSLEFDSPILSKARFAL
jgi:hypothetical protein